MMKSYSTAAIAKAARLMLSLGSGDYPGTQGRLSNVSAYYFSTDLTSQGPEAYSLLMTHDLVHAPGRWAVPTAAGVELAGEIARGAQAAAQTSLGRAAAATELLEKWLASKAV